MKKPNNRWAARYGLLTQFFRGYLHQDFPEEYGSIAGALRQYRQDAGESEYAAFSDQWRTFLTEICDFPAEEVSRILSEDLGGTWHLGSRRELDIFTEAVKKIA